MLGVWALRRYVVEDERGAIIDRPFGEAPEGLLAYHEDGSMSVHAMEAGRRRCDTRRAVECPPEVKIAAYDSYFGYAGSYSLDDDVVTHRVAISCFPDWVGTSLRRMVEISGDRLRLTGNPPGPRIPVLDWERTW
jgi:hypothetical protein